MPLKRETWDAFIEETAKAWFSQRVSTCGALRGSRIPDKEIEWRGRKLLDKLQEVNMARCDVFCSHSTNGIF